MTKNSDAFELIKALKKIDDVVSPGIWFALEREDDGYWTFSIEDTTASTPFFSGSAVYPEDAIEFGLEDFIRNTTNLLDIQPGWRITRMGDPPITTDFDIETQVVEGSGVGFVLTFNDATGHWEPNENDIEAFDTFRDLNIPLSQEKVRELLEVNNGGEPAEAVVGDTSLDEAVYDAANYITDLYVANARTPLLASLAFQRIVSLLVHLGEIEDDNDFGRFLLQYLKIHDETDPRFLEIDEAFKVLVREMKNTNLECYGADSGEPIMGAREFGETLLAARREYGRWLVEAPDEEVCPGFISPQPAEVEAAPVEPHTHVMLVDGTWKRISETTADDRFEAGGTITTTQALAEAAVA